MLSADVSVVADLQQPLHVIWVGSTFGLGPCDMGWISEFQAIGGVLPYHSNV